MTDKKKGKEIPVQTQVRNDDEFLNNIDFILTESIHEDKTEVIKCAVRYYKRLFEKRSSEIKILLAK